MQPFDVDPRFPWNSYMLVGSPEDDGPRVVHVTTSDLLYPGCTSFKDTIYAQFKDVAPLPFIIVITEGGMRCLKS